MEGTFGMTAETGDMAKKEGAEAASGETEVVGAETVAPGSK